MTFQRSLTDTFASDEFIEDNRSFYDEYIELRVHGYSQQSAFLKVFGSEYWPASQAGHQRVQDMEATDYFKEQFAARLKTVKVDDLWHTKLALHELLATVRNVFTKDSTKLAAIKELNVLVGITVVDENGKTKAGKTLADFYEKEGDDGAAPAQPGSPAGK